MTQLTTKERRTQIRRATEEHVIEHQFIQQQPYTALELRLELPNGTSLFGKGFAKVQYPQWDPEYCYKLAYNKAMANIIRQVMLAQEEEFLQALHACWTLDRERSN